MVGKGRDQLDLLVGEEANTCDAPIQKHPNWLSFAKKRHAQHSAKATKLLGLMQLIIRIGLRIENMHRRAIERRSTNHAAFASFQL